MNPPSFSLTRLWGPNNHNNHRDVRQASDVLFFFVAFLVLLGDGAGLATGLGLACHRSCMPLNLLPRDFRRRPIDIPLRWKAAGGKAGAGATRAPPFPGFGCGLCLGRVPGPKPRVARPGSPPPPPLSQPLHPVLGAIGRLYRFRSCCCWGLTLAPLLAPPPFGEFNKPPLGSLSGTCQTFFNFLLAVLTILFLFLISSIRGIGNDKAGRCSYNPSCKSSQRNRDNGTVLLRTIIHHHNAMTWACTSARCRLAPVQAVLRCQGHESMTEELSF